MSGIKDEERLVSVRDRLYARNAKEVHAPRHSLTEEQLRARRKQAPRQWNIDQPQGDRQPIQAGPRVDLRTAMPAAATDIRSESVDQIERQPATASSDDTSTVTQSPKKRRYRILVILFALLALVSGAAYTFFFGITEISSRNISLTVSAPSSIGSGEEVPIDIRIRNDNPVAIVSGTLVVQFPEGSREADDSTRILRTSRIPLERIEPGAELTIPVRPVIFGEMGDEKEINARLDYRVSGTNSILERAIDPLTMQITSAPFTFQVETTEQVAAGQEIDIVINLDSNAPNILSDILITAEYPSGFEFIESNPSPVFGQNVWRIDELEAAGRESITVRGLFTGGTQDEFAMNFSAGLPHEGNRFAIGSLFATDRVNFLIEQPFFTTVLSINGAQGESIAVSSGQTSNVRVSVTNTLDSAVYDVRLAARLSGNALDPDQVRVRDGFYDSVNNVVRFDVTTNRDLERIAPGATRSFSFEVEPRLVGTAQIDVETDVFARRTSDTNAQEQLVGQSVISAQYTSVIDLSRSLLFDSGLFANTGPVPPVAEQQTTYTVDLVVTAGLNDLLDGQVEFSLPTYVEWLDRYEGPGSVEFNPVNQQLVWSIGAITADDVVRLQFQIAFSPSRSQVGQSPVLVNIQRLRATDRFTGVVVRDQANVLSTELPASSGFPRRNGIVQSVPTILPNDSELADDEED